MRRRFDPGRRRDGGRTAAAALPISVLAALAGLFTAGQAHADGGFIYGPDRDVWEPEQAAVLVYDAARQQEDLILRVRSMANTRDFGWIVPVPALPAIREASAELFRECALMTAPVRHERTIACGTAKWPTYAPEGSVDIYDQRQVGIFMSMVVGSRDAAALTDSLTSWGFLHAENREAALAMLRVYTDRAWFFAVFRTDSTSSEPRPPGYQESALQPVHLSFRSPRPIYPLQISALSTRGVNSVLLYVCADHRMTFDRASTEYANRITVSEWSAVRERYPHLAGFVRPGTWVTKLRHGYSADEMDADLELSPAGSDEEFRPVFYTGAPGSELPLLAGVVAVFIAVKLRGRRASARTP